MTDFEYVLTPGNGYGKVARASGYACPKCLKGMKTADSRRTPEGYVHRRRICTSCGVTTKTIEHPQGITLLQQKRLIDRILNSLDELNTLADLLRAEHEP